MKPCYEKLTRVETKDLKICDGAEGQSMVQMNLKLVKMKNKLNILKCVFLLCAISVHWVSPAVQYCTTDTK